MLRRENGITLVALIITIIILVILAAVSIAAVTNMKIVDYAVNGSQDYAREAKREETEMNTTVDLLKQVEGNLTNILKNN